MNQTITLPREVAAAIAQILIDAKTGECDYQDGRVKWSIDQLAAALEQPQRKLTSQEIADSALLGNIESQFNACMHQEHCKRWKAQADQHHQHQHKLSRDNDLQRENGQLSTTSSSVPFGYKLAPVVPNRAMLEEAQSASECYGDFDDRTDEEWSEWTGLIWDVMLAAAPQPPTTEGSSEVQAQGEQEPAAMAKVVGMDEYGPMLLWNRAWTDFPVGTKLYTHPKPQREPQFDAISVDQERLAEQFCAEIAGPRGGKPSLPDPVRLLEMAEALYRAEAHQNGAIERAHRIGGEA